MGIGGPAVVVQRPQKRICIGLVVNPSQSAGAVASQVVAVGANCTDIKETGGSYCLIADDTVSQKRVARSVIEPAPGRQCGVGGDGAVFDSDRTRSGIKNTAAGPAALSENVDEGPTVSPRSAGFGRRQSY